VGVPKGYNQQGAFQGSATGGKDQQDAASPYVTGEPVRPGGAQGNGTSMPAAHCFSKNWNNKF